ncbi:MAG TPA: DUF692 family protein, partial [Pyrinomonadaceae bacterium]|nr:DUF692 family protein [Pyrinomonadaceae bacterium]
GVGFPVGGLLLPDDGHFLTLNEHIDHIQPTWISEHLSFNRFEDNGEKKQVNFLLPPLQTDDGVNAAVAAIRNYRSQIKLPFAFETGVNYLSPKAFEMDDGDFVAKIAEAADCHILLDVHNILANQKNGRQSVKDFVSQLPIERICEIHVAGGFEYKNCYLDAHSGVSSDELFGVLEWVVRRTPSLKAIVFEMLPEYVEEFSKLQIRRQFEEMQRVWEMRGKTRIRRTIPTKAARSVNRLRVEEWELTLGKLALSKPVEDSQLKQELADDTGLEVIRDLVFHLRASMIVGSLTLTTRLLRLTWGSDAFNEHLANFMRESDAQLFELLTAEKYADHLIGEGHRIPFLYKILEFETATAKTKADSVVREVEFDFDPFPVLKKLSANNMPEPQTSETKFLLKITPDEVAYTPSLGA